MVSSPNAHALRVEKDVQGVQGREAGRVGQAGAMEERAQDRFETRARGGCCAGVDVGVGRLWPLDTGGKRDQLSWEWNSSRGDEWKYFYVFCGDEVIWVRGVAEGGGDVEGG